MHGEVISPITGRTTVCVALTALVFFSRAWLVRVWASPLPFADQWDAELIGLYLPWLNGTLHWQDLFRAHNEHRILLTRLADLVLFVTCGGWNPWAQLLLNSALHAATAGALAMVFWDSLSRNARAVFIAGLALFFTATCGWQNALFGFQSQVYFANLFAVGAIAGLCAGSPLRLSWWLGLAAAVCAFFSNAGGILAAAALAIGLFFTGQTTRTNRTWTALSLSAVTALAFLPGSAAPQHAAFHAQNVGQFIAVLSHCLAWPWINLGLACLVLQAPLAYLVFDRWRRKEQLDTADRCALALGLFALLQSAAIAYTRGAVLPESRPLSRYQDPLLLGVAGQLFALLRIFPAHGQIGRLAGFVWCGLIVGGLIGLTETNFTVHLPYKRAQDRTNLALVRAYASTGDASVFIRDSRFPGAHPDPHVIERAIDDRVTRNILPVSVLAPIEASVSNLPWPIQYARILTIVSGLFLSAVLLVLCRTKSYWPHATMAPQTGPH